MDRTLDAKEQKVLERFSKHGVERLDVKQVSFTGQNMAFNVKDPVVYKIAGTTSVLIFGEPRKSMSLDDIKTWLEQQTKAGKSGDVSLLNNEGAAEIDGDGADGDYVRHAEGDGAEADAEEDSRIQEEDVQLIMNQVKLPREEVIRVLKKTNYDVVNALVELAKNN